MTWCSTANPQWRFSGQHLRTLRNPHCRNQAQRTLRYAAPESQFLVGERRAISARSSCKPLKLRDSLSRGERENRSFRLVGGGGSPVRTRLCITGKFTGYGPLLTTAWRETFQVSTEEKCITLKSWMRQTACENSEAKWAYQRTICVPAAKHMPREALASFHSSSGGAPRPTAYGE
jgi:hypothetical protein